MGAKFGSATTTWWPSASKHRATHSLFVEASRRMHAGSLPQQLGEAGWIGADPPFNQLAALGQDADLAFPLVQIDANMVYGWPPSLCATERVLSLWGTLCHHVESGGQPLHPIYALDRKGGSH